MTITDKEFIKRVCEKAGIIDNRPMPLYRYGFIKLDYNICMKAVENINNSCEMKIIMSEDAWHVYYEGYRQDDILKWSEYGSMLLALQHALLYVMENDK